MSTLLVISYDSQFKAEEVRLNLLKLQKEYLLDVEDAITANKNHKGKIKYNKTNQFIVTNGDKSDAFWGMLVGTLLLYPFESLSQRTDRNTVENCLEEAGIDKKFVEEMTTKLVPDSSVLFLLIPDDNVDKVIEDLKNTGGHIQKTTLSHTDEERLQAALKTPSEAGK